MRQEIERTVEWEAHDVRNVAVGLGRLVGDGIRVKRISPAR